MKGYFRFPTRAGEVRIIPLPNGRWAPWFDEETLGSYPTPQSAVEAIAGGHCDWPSFGDTSRLGIPEEIAAWAFVRTRR